MVSFSAPISYESLKAVLLHKDPNLRFKIAQRIPKFRLTEKAVPLRIESLSLREFTTTINNTSYKLGVYRNCHTGKIPKKIKKKNNCGGVSCDLDQDGCKISNSSTPILNGDVSFRAENAAIFQRENTEQDALAKINKRNNLSPTFACSIQLTIEGNFKTIQRYGYNHKLYEAAKKLNEVLFANRPVIIVNKFEGTSFNCVWRIPVGLKISANSISYVFGEYDQIVSFSSILDSSRTLQNVGVFVSVLNDQHSFVKNAQQLTICTRAESNHELIRAFGTMDNQQINIEFPFDSPRPSEYFQLLQGWLSTERSVGSVITFELKTEYIGEEILELVRAQNERTESTDRWVKVVLKNGTKLKVSCWCLRVKYSFKSILTAIIQKA